MLNYTYIYKVPFSRKTWTYSRQCSP